VIGAGDLFDQQAVSITLNGAAAQVTAPGTGTAHGLPKFSGASLLLLAVALPLIGRFFVRATLGYQQLERYNKVRNAQWRHLSGQHTWEHARGHYDVYVVKWRTPRSLGELVQGSAKYGFVWIFVLYVMVLRWAFYTADGGVLPRAIAAVAIVFGLVYDIVTLRRSSLFTQPTAAEIAQTVPDVPPGFVPGGDVSESKSDAKENSAAGLGPSETVFFVGRRFRGKRSR
jgi:hypothetical protein